MSLAEYRMRCLSCLSGWVAFGVLPIRCCFCHSNNIEGSAA